MRDFVTSSSSLQMTPILFSQIFLCAFAFSLLAKYWLGMRHMRHIVKMRGKVPEEFAEKISLAEHQKAADYTCAKTRLGLFSDTLDALLVLLFTFGGGIEFLDSRLGFEDPLFHGVLLIGSIVLVTSILEIPANLYKDFVLEERFGFNKSTPMLFFTDLLKQALLAALFGLPLLFALLKFMQMKNWWLYAWIFWVGFNLLILAIYPTFIAPFFNKFKPMEDETLKERIEALLRKCGFKAQGLYVMDGSKRSNHGNAYFTGFGKTKRIVFFDTLLSRLQAPEIEAVLAHELGHFKHKHVLQRMAAIFAMSLVFLYLLDFLADKNWFYAGLGVSRHSDAIALVLFFTAIPAFTFLLKPLSSFLSRKQEFEADAYAAKESSAQELIKALVRLYQDNAATLTPDPAFSAFYDSHPPAALRIAHLHQLKGKTR